MMSLLMGISFQKAAEGSTDVDMIKQQQIEKFLESWRKRVYGGLSRVGL